MTDEEGRFEFFVGPGKFRLNGPNQTEPRKFEIVDEKEYEYSFASQRREKGMFKCLVVDDATDEPMAGVAVTGIYRNMRAGADLKATTDANGQFEVMRQLHRTVLYGRSEDRTMKGVVEIGHDDESAVIRLTSVGQARGRLIDEETQEPLANETIRYGIQVYLGAENGPMRTAFGSSVETDDEGRFLIEGLILGHEYRIAVEQDGGQRTSGIGKVTAE